MPPKASFGDKGNNLLVLRKIVRKEKYKKRLNKNRQDKHIELGMKVPLISQWYCLFSHFVFFGETLPLDIIQ